MHDNDLTEWPDRKIWGNKNWIKEIRTGQF